MSKENKPTFWKKLVNRYGYGEYKTAKHSTRNRIVVTNWNSDEGRLLLDEAHYKNAFFRLAHHYQAQINPFFCGVASMTTALNCLRIGKNIPSQQGFDYVAPDGREIFYEIYSQLTVLNKDTEEIKRKVDIAPSIKNFLAENGQLVDESDDFDPGLSLYHVDEMLKTYGLNVERNKIENYSEEVLAVFIHQLRHHLNDEHSVIIVNFEGKDFGATTGGHFSIVAAYDDASDSVLVLDAAAHKNPWYWVPVKHLCHAMNTLDGNDYRGYLVVSDKKERKND